MKKKRYRLTVEITQVSGFQTYEVEARSAAEALRLWKEERVDGVVDQCLDVTATGDVKVEEIKTEGVSKTRLSRTIKKKGGSYAQDN